MSNVPFADQVGKLVEQLEQPVPMLSQLFVLVPPLVLLSASWLACGGHAGGTITLFPLLYLAYVWQARMLVGGPRQPSPRNRQKPPASSAGGA